MPVLLLYWAAFLSDESLFVRMTYGVLCRVFRALGACERVRWTIRRDSQTSCSDIEKGERGSCISGRAVIEVLTPLGDLDCGRDYW